MPPRRGWRCARAGYDNAVRGALLSSLNFFCDSPCTAWRAALGAAVGMSAAWLHMHSMQCLHFPRCCPHSPRTESASPPPFLPAQGSAAVYTCMRHLTTQGSGSRNAAAVLTNSSSIRAHSSIRILDPRPLLKRLIYLWYANPQEVFKQHLIKNEGEPSFAKIYSANFGEVLTL